MWHWRTFRYMASSKVLEKLSGPGIPRFILRMRINYWGWYQTRVNISKSCFLFWKNSPLTFLVFNFLNQWFHTSTVHIKYPRRKLEISAASICSRVCTHYCRQMITTKKDTIKGTNTLSHCVKLTKRILWVPTHQNYTLSNKKIQT